MGGCTGDEEMIPYECGTIDKEGAIPMNSKLTAHLYLFYAATTFWTLFFLGGLGSGYYQKWPFVSQLLFIFILPALLLIAFAPKLIYCVNSDYALGSAIIAALYFILPLQVYDYIYLHLHLKKPMTYFFKYWYLTYFSLVPLLLFPVISYRRRNKMMMFRV